MENKKRVFSYFDGSNFYHQLKNSYNLQNVDFNKISKSMLNENENLMKIHYFNSLLNRQEDEKGYSNQLKFIEKIKKTALIEIHFRKLTKRPIEVIHLNCPVCGVKKLEFISCPQCGRNFSVNNIYKSTEKGIDINLAITLLLDALEDKYDSALLFSGDADFVPVIDYIINKLKKEIIYCYFPKFRTSELIQNCSSIRLITQDIINKSKI